MKRSERRRLEPKWHDRRRRMRYAPKYTHVLTPQPTDAVPIQASAPPGGTGVERAGAGKMLRAPGVLRLFREAGCAISRPPGDAADAGSGSAGFKEPADRNRLCRGNSNVSHAEWVGGR